MKQSYQNRIVGYGNEAPDQLLANPRNARIHPKAQADALKGVLSEVGWVQDVIVNQRSGMVVDGHLRIALALREKQPSIPVKYVDLSDDEERLILATLDPISAAASWDREKLDDLLRDVSTGDAAVQQLLADLAESVDIPSVQVAGAGGDEFDVDSALEGDCRVQFGDVWTIGGVHRMCCGDSTDAATVARLMEGERADAVISDPPYGIDWNTNYTRFTSGYNIPRRNSKPIANDDKPFDPTPWLKYPLTILFGANYFADKLPVGTWLVWDKRHSNGTALLSDAELAWMSKNKGVYIYSKTWQGIVRDEDIEHPTQKPIGLMEWCFEKAGLERNITVLDPFLGSGTTLIAAHRTQRHCYGIEIEPRYCEVVLKRAEAEGLSVELTERLNAENL
jgi:hypothetical protein